MKGEGDAATESALDGFGLRRSDARGDGRSGDSVWSRFRQADQQKGDPFAGRDIPPRVAQLRRAAFVARAEQTTTIRRITLQLAIATGQPISDIERLTFRDTNFLTGLVQRSGHGSRR